MTGPEKAPIPVAQSKNNLSEREMKCLLDN